MQIAPLFPSKTNLGDQRGFTRLPQHPSELLQRSRPSSERCPPWCNQHVSLCSNAVCKPCASCVSPPPAPLAARPVACAVWCKAETCSQEPCAECPADTCPRTAAGADKPCADWCQQLQPGQKCSNAACNACDECVSPQPAAKATGTAAAASPPPPPPPACMPRLGPNP